MKPQATGGEAVELRTADGTDLQGVLYRPTGQHRRAVVAWAYRSAFTRPSPPGSLSAGILS
jgi:hypothetical protein